MTHEREPGWYWVILNGRTVPAEYRHERFDDIDADWSVGVTYFTEQEINEIGPRIAPPDEKPDTSKRIVQAALAWSDDGDWQIWGDNTTPIADAEILAAQELPTFADYQTAIVEIEIPQRVVVKARVKGG